MPDWLFSWNTITFQKNSWCSLFTWFDCKTAKKYRYANIWMLCVKSVLKVNQNLIVSSDQLGLGIKTERTLNPNNNRLKTGEICSHWQVLPIFLLQWRLFLLPPVYNWEEWGGGSHLLFTAVCRSWKKKLKLKNPIKKPQCKILIQVHALCKFALHINNLIPFKGVFFRILTSLHLKFI